jgi:hypothetical protein
MLATAISKTLASSEVVLEWRQRRFSHSPFRRQPPSQKEVTALKNFLDIHKKEEEGYSSNCILKTCDCATTTIVTAKEGNHL